MHYFGSKQQLYRRVIDAAPVPEIGGTPEQAAEQILATLAGRLASAPAASLALLRSMLTNPEAASAASAGIARYEAQIAQAIPAGDADLRATSEVSAGSRGTWVRLSHARSAPGRSIRSARPPACGPFRPAASATQEHLESRPGAGAVYGRSWSTRIDFSHFS
jgi:hypothetical protein